MPGRRWIEKFIMRQRFGLQRQQTLEKARAEVIEPRNLVVHFSELRDLCTKHGTGKFFNLNESGFILRRKRKGRVRVVTTLGHRSKSIDLKCTVNVKRISIVPVVSADGRAWNPVVVLPGSTAR